MLFRSTKTFTLEEGVRKLTADPAARYRIPKRGRIAAGCYADLVLFDEKKVGVSGLKRVPDLPGGGTRMLRDPVGVHGVWVNGVQVHDGAKYLISGRGPGSVLVVQAVDASPELVEGLTARGFDVTLLVQEPLPRSVLLLPLHLTESLPLGREIFLPLFTPPLGCLDLAGDLVSPLEVLDRVGRLGQLQFVSSRSHLE